MSKTNIIITVLLALAVLLVVFVQFVKAPTVEEEVVETPAEVIEDESLSSTYKDLIRVDTPLPGSSVSSPLLITGEARGMWYFEASFPIVVVNWDGLIIGEGYATALDDWMTEEYVPFSATIVFDADTSVSDRGSIILQKSNASGLPEHDDAFEYVVKLVE